MAELWIVIGKIKISTNQVHYKFCSNNNLIRYIAKMPLYEDIYMGHYQIKRTFSCSYYGDFNYFRSRFALAY